MITRGKLVATLLVVSLFLVFASSASAAGPVTVTQEIVDGTATWSMTPAQCGELQVPLAGVGQRHEVIITQVFADGSQTNITNDVVKGTASDSTGTYHFSYTNHATRHLPAGGGPISIAMVDSFVLNGSGTAKLNVHFNWRWTYTPPAEEWPPVDNWQQISTVGDPLHCDPL